MPGSVFFFTFSGSGNALLSAMFVTDDRVFIYLGHSQKVQSCTAYGCFETFRKHLCHFFGVPHRVAIEGRVSQLGTCN